MHNTENMTEIEHCHDPGKTQSRQYDKHKVQLFIGCYQKDISYIDGQTQQPIALSQIESLIELSEHCEQSFNYDCTLAPLSDSGVDYAYWEDRHGEQNVYFTGNY